MKKFIFLPVLLVACGAIPSAPVLKSLGASVQVCSAGCATDTDTRSLSYLVNFKEILFIRANKTRTSVEFGKDISDPACTLNVTTPINNLSLQRGDGHSAVAVSNDVVTSSRWQMICPSYDSGWNVF